MRKKRISDWRAARLGLCILALAGGAAAGCKRAHYTGTQRLLPGDPYEFCVGVYTGATPIAIEPRAEAPQAPAFTGADVPLVPASFVADPFVVRRDGTWHLFFELLNARSSHGDIGLATSRDGLKWRFERTVLDEPFHLSYPFVFEWNGGWYMLPEGAHSGALTLYRAVDFPLRWEPDVKLLDGSYVDSTLLQYSNRWWMFTTPAGTRDLLLFMADTPRGPWLPHPLSPIIRNNGDIARCGGRMIVYNGTPLRFTQDVDPTYGNALRAFRITKLTATEYAEEPAAAGPILNATGQGWRARGMHQIDPVEVQPGQWVALVDGVGPALPDTPLKVEFANGVRLDGISVRPTVVQAGSPVLLRCFLSGVPAVSTNQIAVFAHLSPGRSKTVLQGDIPVNPTNTCYQTLIQVPSNAPPGRYEMRIGLYDPTTGLRVALKDRNGSAQAPHRIGGVLQVLRTESTASDDQK